LREGRLLLESDSADASPVVVVNQALVSNFPNQDAIGQRVRVGADSEPWRTIVGVVGDVKTSGLAAAAEPAIYLPYGQSAPLWGTGVLMRSALSAGTVAPEFRKLVAAIDPNQPVASIESMDARLNASVSAPRFTAALLFLFAGLAVLLGCIGVYGVMGCRVRWQLRELAVRQALGATPVDVMRHVLLQGAAVIAPGLLIGICGSLALGRALADILFQVSPHDPLTLAAVSAGLGAAALLACFLPAARAAQSDPLHFLRQD
jgi:hypothetical protein